MRIFAITLRLGGTEPIREDTFLAETKCSLLNLREILTKILRDKYKKLQKNIFFKISLQYPDYAKKNPTICICDYVQKILSKLTLGEMAISVLIEFSRKDKIIPK